MDFFRRDKDQAVPGKGHRSHVMFSSSCDDQVRSTPVVGFQRRPEFMECLFVKHPWPHTRAMALDQT